MPEKYTESVVVGRVSVHSPDSVLHHSLADLGLIVSGRDPTTAFDLKLTYSKWSDVSKLDIRVKDRAVNVTFFKDYVIEARPGGIPMVFRSGDYRLPFLGLAVRVGPLSHFVFEVAKPGESSGFGGSSCVAENEDCISRWGFARPGGKDGLMLEEHPKLSELVVYRPGYLGLKWKMLGSPALFQRQTFTEYRDKSGTLSAELVWSDTFTTDKQSPEVPVFLRELDGYEYASMYLDGAFSTIDKLHFPKIEEQAKFTIGKGLPPTLVEETPNTSLNPFLFGAIVLIVVGAALKIMSALRSSRIER